MESPLVSVIIPTYKRDWSFLGRAVSSVQNQTYENIEIIVVDDSPNTFKLRDEIASQMQSLCAGDDRLRYIQNENNIGGSLSRNKGILESKGRYITFLDDDDEYLPQKVEKQVAFMLETDCDMSFANMKMYNKSGTVVDKREYKDIWSFENEELLKYHLMKHLTGTPTYMFKREAIKHIGMFDDVPIMQEYFLMLKCIKGGLQIRYFDSCDIKVYKHDGEAITNGRRKVDAEKRLYTIKKEYFPLLTKKQIRYIRFRHWAVMVIAYMRNKEYLMMPIAGILAFIVSPGNFIKEVSGFFKKRNY